MRGIMRKNGMRDCLIFYPEVLGPLPCSFPDQKECGSYVKIIQRRKGLTTAITLCKYRCKEIGRNTCVREQLSWKDSKHK